VSSEKMDSGVLFDFLRNVTITNSQRRTKRMIAVSHFNPSRSFFYSRAGVSKTTDRKYIL